MASILFVCTGNVFRSLVAEYAFRAQLEPPCPHRVASAGIEAVPQAVAPGVRDRLLEKGVDCGGHVQRRLTPPMLAEADLVVAMGLDHRAFIRRVFGREVPLFNEVCFRREEPVLDLHEAVPDWSRDPDAGRRYVLRVVDYVWEAMPTFIAGLPRWLP
jgi:protein-tyrosine phosphatase